jgi:hypothetical protein
MHSKKPHQVRQVKEDFKNIVQELRKSNSTSHLRGSGVAIVVFATAKEQRDCLAKYDNFWTRIIHLSREWTGFGLFGAAVIKALGLKGYEGKLLKITRAPNPSDLNWDDLARTKPERLRESAHMYFSMSVVIGICFSEGKYLLMHRFIDNVG